MSQGEGLIPGPNQGRIRARAPYGAFTDPYPGPYVNPAGLEGGYSQMYQTQDDEPAQDDKRKKIYTWMGDAYDEIVRPNLDDVFNVQQDNSDGSWTYSELAGKLLTRIFAMTGLNRRSQLFIDLGSGIGHAVIQAALETGCKAYGVERRSDRRLLAQRYRQVVSNTVERWPATWRTRLSVSGRNARKNKKRVRFLDVDYANLQTNATQSTHRPTQRNASELLTLITKADVLLCNNRRCNQTISTTQLLEIARCMKPGAQLVTTHPILGIHTGNTPFTGPAVLTQTLRRAFVGISDSGHFWIYTKGWHQN